MCNEWGNADNRCSEWVRRRAANGATGARPGTSQNLSASDGRSSSRGRSAGLMLYVPRVWRHNGRTIGMGTILWVQQPTRCKLDGVGFANKHRATSTKQCHAVTVLVWHAVTQPPAAPCRDHTLGIVYVYSANPLPGFNCHCKVSDLPGCKTGYGMHLLHR